MRKSTLISALLCLNMLLLTAIVLRSYSPPTALAQQGTGLSGNYVTVAGEIQDGYDAVYLIDLQSRYLHAFYYDRGNNTLKHGGFRDLERDFRNRPGGRNP